MNIKQHCDLIRLQGPQISDADEVALVIHNQPGSDPVIMAGQCEQDLIVASVRPSIQHVPFNDSETGKAHFSKAVLAAKDQLKGIDDSTRSTHGHATISTASDGLPLVCKIPSVLIDDRFEGEHEDPLGIYIAYGFGMYGTTVSLGVATALRAMISGEDPGIGEAFDYP